VRRLVTVLLLACAALGIAPPAQAHNVLISSDPKDGATLSAPPQQITLVFDQPARQGYAQIGVTGADGSAWADGAATVAAERVTVKVKPLTADGAYVIGYRILSADGHPVTGKIDFTLAAGGAPAAALQETGVGTDAGAAAAEAAANGGAGMAVVWIVAALLVLAAGTAVALRRSGPRTSPGPTADAPDRSGPQPEADTPDQGGPQPEAGAPDQGGPDDEPVRPGEGARA
jgi:methionine-rich copper-binding protein CopC